MTPELIEKTTFLFAAIVLCAVGVWHNDKLVGFEKKIYEFACDRIGYIAAMVYVKYRRRKIDRSIRRVERALDILDKENSYLEKVEGNKNEYR